MGAIRLILALSVAVWHAPEPAFPLLNASVAVTCFFMISGFYMALVINEKYRCDGSASGWVGTFYLARILRLYPAYLFTLLCMVVVIGAGGLTNPFTMRLPMPVWEQALLLLSNLTMIGQDLHQTVIQSVATRSGPAFLQTWHDAFGGAFFQNQMMLVGQAWSLAVELTFYAIAPFVVSSWRRTLALLVISLVVRWLLLGVLGYVSWIWGYYFTPGCLCMFLLGSLSYHVRRALPAEAWHRTAGWVALAVLAGWFGWTLITEGLVMPYGDGLSIDRPRFWVLYISFAAALPFMFEATRRSGTDRWIGDLSYPIYLSHGLALGIADRVSVYGGVPKSMSLMLGIILAVALAIHLAVERPVEWWRQRLAGVISR